MSSIKVWVNTYMKLFLDPIEDLTLTNILEILILALLVYNVLLWIKNTKAWTLLKGMVVLVCCVSLVYILRMDTLKFIVSSAIDVAIIAALVIFQPELRRALEQIGEKRIVSSLFPLIDSDREVSERFSDKTLNEIVKASSEMSKVKTGALIVIEQDIRLDEYERTGITLDSVVTSQLLINIFEHNTPLHDGAVIIKGNRITSATCYLPLSDNMMLSKELGTRHRAGVGISEVTDSLTVIVSEETGKISIAYLQSYIQSHDYHPELVQDYFLKLAEEAGELARAIDRWLDGLDRPDRTAFLRRYWYGQRVDQVARQAGCAPNTMTKRLGRLRDSLRRALEQEGISV